MTEPAALALVPRGLGPLWATVPQAGVVGSGDAYAAYFALQLNAPSSRTTLRSKLGSALRECFGFEDAPSSFPWASLRYLHTAALRAWLVEHRAPATARSVLTAVRGILRQCYRLELVSETNYRRAIDLPPVRGERVPPGRSVPVGEIRALFAAACGQRLELAARNAAILAVLYGGGLRRAELAALDDGDVNDDATRLRVLGKGNKQREIHLPAGAVRALRCWIAARELPLHAALVPLFWATSRSGTVLVPNQRISRDTVYHLLGRLAKLAGVARLTPHDLRRSFVGELLDAGADIATVAGMAGHASVTTTQRYDRRGERAKVRASELLVVPFGDG